LPSLAEIQAERARRARKAEAERVRQDADAIRARCVKFSGFVKEAWHILEPSNALKWSWHLDAICDHLEGITFGQLTPWLIINVPPGSSKSMLVSVLWQAYEWGPCGMRSSRFLSTSFELENVKRDTRKTRDLIASEWFHALWPEVVMVRSGETSFANADTGTREGVPFVAITGKRADRLTIDDPHSLDGAESDIERTKATRRFLEGGLNRVNDQTTSAIVVVMQRLHDADLTGVLLARRLGFVHLMIPMEFEPERRCETVLGWKDPRSYDGELMDPVRMPRTAVDRLKSVGDYSWAGQYQQRPVSREGGLFKRAWFDDKEIQLHEIPGGTHWCRHWDLAATKRKASDTRGARTAGVKIGRTPDGRYIVADCIAKAIDGFAVRELILATTQIDGFAVQISIAQDPGQAAKVQKQEYLRLLDGFNLRFLNEGAIGDKEARAVPFAAQCEGGNVWLLKGRWHSEFLDEICLFPNGARKDIVDACSGAYARLIPAHTWDEDGGVSAPMVFTKPRPEYGYEEF
jgi:predicted phage terminase large subunit-like protein